MSLETIKPWEIEKELKSKMENGGVLSVVFAGVGGQGILLATTIMSKAVLKEGYDVKVSEVHGMAQRGGSVTGVLRFGNKVYASTSQTADIIIAMEKMEALRYMDKLNKSGIILVNDLEIWPVSIYSSKKPYPGRVSDEIKKFTERYFFIEAAGIAKSLGNLKIINVVLLGMLSKFLPVSLESWHYGIEKSVPQKVIELNLKAFRAGIDFK